MHHSPAALYQLISNYHPHCRQCWCSSYLLLGSLENTLKYIFELLLEQNRNQPTYHLENDISSLLLEEGILLSMLISTLSTYHLEHRKKVLQRNFFPFCSFFNVFLYLKRHWQCNLFLTPACSCVYLNVEITSRCDAVGTNYLHFLI